MMTSALGLKLHEAIERAEARKAMEEWTKQTPTPMTTTPISLSETAFNMVRDNPGITKKQAVANLEKEGHNAVSTTSLLSVMVRYGLITMGDSKTLHAVGDTYKPRAEFNKLSKKKEVRMIRRPAEATPDVINHPAHYKVGGIETIDFIKAKLTPEEFRGYLLGNVLKYASRAGHKDNALQDAGKMAWYANKLAEAA